MSRRGLLSRTLLGPQTVGEDYRLVYKAPGRPPSLGHLFPSLDSLDFETYDRKDSR